MGLVASRTKEDKRGRIHSDVNFSDVILTNQQKGNLMAHEVTLDISTKFVLHKDVTIDVKKDGRKLGTALISKGNIEWLPAGNSVNKKRLSWEKFAKLMVAEGKDIRMD